MDGALGSRGAALLEPYSDAEGLGLQLTPRDKGLALMKQAKAAGAQVAMHAIGDRGNRMTLDWFEESLQRRHQGPLAHRARADRRRHRRAALRQAGRHRLDAAQPRDRRPLFRPRPPGQGPAARGLSLEGLPGQRGGDRRRLGRPGRGGRPAHRVLRRRLSPQPGRLRQRRLASGRGRQPRPGPAHADLGPRLRRLRRKGPRHAGGRQEGRRHGVLEGPDDDRPGRRSSRPTRC
jgi:hypothetical protein